MTRPAIRQADVARVIRGALSAGLPAGSFVVEVGEKVIRLLPAAPVNAHGQGDDGEAEWDKALGLR